MATFRLKPVYSDSTPAHPGLLQVLAHALPWLGTGLRQGRRSLAHLLIGLGLFFLAANSAQAATAPSAPTVGTATAGDTQASISFSTPASDGGAAITGYTVTSNPGGFTGSGAGSPITVTGLTNGVAYTFTVTATNSAGTGSASAASNSATPQAAQTITFHNPGAQNFSTSPTLSASATSSLAVAFSSSTTGVCTITAGGAATFVTAGTCTINADQAGGGAYLAAATVSQSFTVNVAVPGAPTGVSATAGNTQANVAFTAPAFTGGAAITGYTVTSNPGGFTATGATSPLTITGLTNGLAYTFTTTATNFAGTGAASVASPTMTPVAVTVSGTTPGMVGTATATLSGGGSSCTLEPTSNFGSLPVAAPSGVTMGYGAFKYDASSCVGSVTMTLTYPQALPASVQFWKYGPATAGALVSTWFQWSGATISPDRKTVSYTVIDNGVGDANSAVGRISDPFAPAVGPAGGGVVGVPVDAPWALAMLSAALGWLGWRRLRRAGSAG